ncbi:hypothetical protein M569_17585 [Genlisea aurea]|uniref:Uncharacterized protein n=1 Tax=Genlisea aurea TaxID=192259 RepID=S8BRH9_9LAMI|nr:hypothetical protein M569_17585 [Genlisea aurea]
MGYPNRYLRIPFRFPKYFIGNRKGFRAFGNSKRYSRKPKGFPSFQKLNKNEFLKTIL